MNENPSVCIESAGSKTCDNRPLKNRDAVSIARLYVGSKIVCFYESDHAFKTIWRRPCLCHLIKVKGYFLKPGRLVFIIVINTSCSGVCYRIYARQKFLNNALMPNGALALFGIFAGRISCNKRPHNRYLFLHHIGETHQKCDARERAAHSIREKLRINNTCFVSRSKPSLNIRNKGHI